MKAIQSICSVMVCVVMVGCGSNPALDQHIPVPPYVEKRPELKPKADQASNAASAVSEKLDEAKGKLDGLQTVIDEQAELIEQLSDSSVEDGRGDELVAQLKVTVQKVKQAYDELAVRFNESQVLANESQMLAAELAVDVEEKEQEVRELRYRGEALHARYRQTSLKLVERDEQIMQLEAKNEKLKKYRAAVWWALGIIAVFLFCRYILPPLVGAFGKSINPLS